MRSRMKAFLRSLSKFCLAAVFAFEAAFPVFADGASLDFRSPPAPAPGAPSPAALAALPVYRMGPAAFAAFVGAHAARVRPLAGALGSAAWGDASGPPAARACDTLPAEARARCLDSLARLAPGAGGGPRALREMEAKEAARRDSAGGNREVTQDAALPDTQPAVVGAPRRAGGDQDLDDEDSPEKEEARGWFADLFADFRDGGGKDGGWDAHDWAVLIYVVVGVVVVGAFLVYGLQTLGELILNREDYPVFQEAGLRLSYSGHAWRDGAGADLYRDAYLAGLRYAIGFERPGADVGLALEAGYIDIRLTPQDGPGNAFDFRGAYLVAGPLIRFGSFDPLCFSLEFLNGTSTHPSIGWISKARMALQARFGRHEVAGVHLGAVFYDLSFLDGLAIRQGDFNRDLSLVGGLDFGWEF